MSLRNRLERWLGFGLALSVLTIPAALAGTKPDDRPVRPVVGARGASIDTSDVVSRYIRSHAPTRPDDQEGALGVGGVSVPAPDVFERYVAAHPYGAEPSAASPVKLASSAGLSWEDYGAGVATGLAIVLLLAGGLLTMPMWRRRVRIG